MVRRFFCCHLNCRLRHGLSEEERSEACIRRKGFDRNGVHEPPPFYFFFFQGPSIHGDVTWDDGLKGSSNGAPSNYLMG
jgi:hypothetical protein